MSWGVDAVTDLAIQYRDCKACPNLCRTRSEVIFGSGSVRADLMVLGEAPGPEEDELGEPFVGRSGRLLMDMLRMKWPENDLLTELSKMDEDEDDVYFDKLRDYLDNYVFWTNTTLCWPGEGNRTPSAQEIKACRDRLHRTIYAVDPMLILVAGATAASALVGKKVGILDKRGQLFDVYIDSPVTGAKVRYAALAILHPSFLLRKGDQELVAKEDGHTYNTLEDIEYGLELLKQQYRDVFGTEFPDKPEEYKR